MRQLARIAVAALLLPPVSLLVACGGGSGSVTPSVPAPLGSPGPTGPAGKTVSIPIHGLTPSVMAYQAGTSGKWTAVTPSGGSVSFTLPTGVTSYSLAYFCPMNNVLPQPNRSGPAEVVVEATTSDSPQTYCVPGPAASGTVNATVFVETSQFPNTDLYSVGQMLPGATFLGAGFGGTAGGDGVGSPLWYSGSSDLIAQVSDGTTGALIAARIVRNVTLTTNATLSLDPISPSGDAVTTQTATIGGSQWGAYWVTAEGGARFMGGGSGAPNVPLIPAASALSGDYYQIQSSGSVGGQFVFGMATGSTPSSINVAVPAVAFTYANASNTGDFASMNIPYTGFTVSGTKYYELDLSWAETTAPVAAGAPLLNVLASQSYLGTSTTVSVPDLSSVPGMLPKPNGGVQVGALGEDYVASGPIPWDDLEVGNAFSNAPLPINTRFQTVQSNYFTFNAP